MTEPDAEPGRLTASIDDLAGIAAQLGCSVQVVEARKGIVILYYTDPCSQRILENCWDELHVRLDRTSRILVAVLPE
jgi:hypothetical protein